MVKSDYLRLREIILGLREEYQNTYNQLQDLKYDDLFLSKGINATLGIYSDDNVNYYLLVNLEKKLSFLENLLNLFSRKDFSITQLDSYGLDYRKNYIFINDKRLFDVIDENRFYENCDKILSTKFNSGLKDVYKTLDDEGLNIKVGHNGVFAVTDLNSVNNPVIGVDYFADNDKLVINNYYGDSLFYNKANAILNTRIPKSILNTDIVSIIEENPVSKYPIEFDGLTDSKEAQRFDLEVKNDYVLAKRVK